MSTVDYLGTRIEVRCVDCLGPCTLQDPFDALAKRPKRATALCLDCGRNQEIILREADYLLVSQRSSGAPAPSQEELAAWSRPSKIPRPARVPTLSLPDANGASPSPPTIALPWDEAPLERRHEPLRTGRYSLTSEPPSSRTPPSKKSAS